jgi:hypothetical protein
MRLRKNFVNLAIVAISLRLLNADAFSQTDEIQVYTGDIANPGEVNLTLHNNYTISGQSVPRYPGAVIANHSLNGVPEFAYGLNMWCELGLYLPVYTVTSNHNLYTESGKLRALFATPDADKKDFFYGVNFELSQNASRWEDKKYSGEIRPIVGFRHQGITYTINPIVDTGFDGLKRMDFAPCVRVSYDLSTLWTIAAEEYADFGPLNNPYKASDQTHSLFFVLDRNSKYGFELGIGHGLTNSSDKWIIKFMFNTLLSPSHHDK